MQVRPALCWRNRGVRTNDHEAELTVAPALLEMLCLEGRLLTGDALYCQRGLCKKVNDRGGDYLVVVKRNQRRLYDDIALLFAEPPIGEVFGTAEQRDRHGDRHEVRRIWVSTALEGYLDWPGARQVCKVERQMERKGKTVIDVRYAITSRRGIPAGDLLSRVRGHWAIENKLHWVRDVTFAEDASQIRKGSAPEVMAALRNAVLGLLRQAGAKNVAAALRENSWRPKASLELLGLCA